MTSKHVVIVDPNIQAGIFQVEKSGNLSRVTGEVNIPDNTLTRILQHIESRVLPVTIDGFTVNWSKGDILR